MRKIISESTAPIDEINKIIDLALKPTHLYPNIIENIISNIEINGMAHITGGGFKENIIRSIPDGFQALIDKKSWSLPSVFDWIQGEAGIDSDEMLKTFNCGIGYVIIVKKDIRDSVINHFQDEGIEAYEIGSIKSGEKSVIINHG